MLIEGHKQIYVEGSSLASFFVEKPSAWSTRSTNTNLMQVPKTRTDNGNNAYSVRGPKHWNQLPIDTREIEDKNEFKTSITKNTCRYVNHPT